MRKLLVLFIVLFATVSSANPLRDAIAQGATSIAWKIKTEGVQTCCCDENKGWTNYGGRLEYSDILLIARVEGRKITKLRMVEPNCQLDPAVRFIADVPAETSLDFLLEQLRGADDPEKFVAAIAMHEHPRVDPELIQLARRHEATDVRRQAIFWLGQHAGEKAAGELRRAVDEDPEDDVREHAVFAISQLPKERAVPMLIDLVKTHKRPKIRQRAMFWLAQTGDQRALDLIEEILSR
jgi:hypothetical protein